MDGRITHVAELRASAKLERASNAHGIITIFENQAKLAANVVIVSASPNPSRWRHPTVLGHGN